MPGTDLHKGKWLYVIVGLCLASSIVALIYLIIPQGARAQKTAINRLLARLGTGQVGPEELAAAHALQQMGTNDSQTVLPALIKLLKDPRSEPRRTAVTSLSGLKEEARPAIPALLEYLSQTHDIKDRTAAMLAVWHIDQKAAENAGFKITEQRGN